MTKKSGFINGIQRYKCISCGKQFIGGKRLDNQELWNDYTKGKQTYEQIANKYCCSKRTIQRRLDKIEIESISKDPRTVIVLMDTTYWGREFGLMLFKDAISKENLLKYYVTKETNKLYISGINALKGKGYTISAIVCDGRRGLIQAFDGIPVQMCQFHQSAIMRRYLTKRPKLQASQELMDIMEHMKKTDKESFEGELELWYHKWKKFINERSVNPITGKSFYTHKRLRSAYRSLKTNLPWLFTWQQYINLQIPNTTNAIDGHFADLKNKLRNHNGLSLWRKKKFIDGFLKV